MDLELDGEGLRLKTVSVAGGVQGVEELVELTSDGGEAAQYLVLSSGNLRIRKHLLPTDADVHFVLKTQVAINPKENLALSGLYKTEDLFVTQNESQGFRRITYFLDRPDVLSKYKVSRKTRRHSGSTRTRNADLYVPICALLSQYQVHGLSAAVHPPQRDSLSWSLRRLQLSVHRIASSVASTFRTGHRHRFVPRDSAVLSPLIACLLRICLDSSGRTCVLTCHERRSGSPDNLF